mmetsp:Transcript_46488/g.83099  ORF Transcript_46488/g.83099 Transcript_46488/m.83099 type:complete len:117 (+) Transcript_46488:923-1273(+)
MALFFFGATGQGGWQRWARTHVQRLGTVRGRKAKGWTEKRAGRDGVTPPGSFGYGISTFGVGVGAVGTSLPTLAENVIVIVEKYDALRRGQSVLPRTRGQPTIQPDGAPPMAAHRI